MFTRVFYIYYLILELIVNYYIIIIAIIAKRFISVVGRGMVTQRCPQPWDLEYVRFHGQKELRL